MLRCCVSLFMVAVCVAGCSTRYVKDRSTDPVFSMKQVETVANLSKPPGNIAVSHDHRIFFSFHPEADPDIKVAELVAGVVVPFPEADFQTEREDRPYFDTVLSLRIDANNNLWTLDHGYFGIRQPRLLAFDIKTGEIVHRYQFPSDIAGFGSFLNDFQVDLSGKRVLIADTGAPVPIVGGDPAIIIYDIQAKTARRILDDHPSVQTASNTLHVGEDDLTLLGMPLHFAVDSIALSRDAEWLYYGAVNTEQLYRIQTKHATDPDIDEAALASRVELFAEKSMSDGITTDMDGNIYLSDMEYSAVHRIGQDRQLKTLLKDPALRWPDGFSFGPDGWLYFTCSALMDVIGRSESHIESAAPYQIYRFKPGAEGVPGH